MKHKQKISKLCAAILLVTICVSGLGLHQTMEHGEAATIDFEPRPIERTTDVQDLSIIVPEDDEWQNVGQEIADNLRDKWDVSVDVASSKREDIEDGWSGNVLVIGNLGNNDHMARLYGLRLSYVDAVHPGEGGYQLQTIVDPFGQGGNTVVLGASGLAGAEQGKEELLDILAHEDEPVIPWLAQASVSDEVSEKLPYGRTPSDEDLADGLAMADGLIADLDPDFSKAKALQTLQSRVAVYGIYSQISNHPHYRKIYRKLMKGYSDFLNQYPDEGKAQLNERANMWRPGPQLIAGWSVLEAFPMFNEQDRQEILSALYFTYAANHNDSYLVSAPETGARWNHQTYPALSLYFGASYFMKYGKLPEAENWLERGERIFVGNTSNISYDEGSDYLMHVPSTTLDYAMATGDNRFLSQGLRPSADLNALMIDNLGTMSGGGDVYPFGFSSAYSWDHSIVMNAASWFFDDPVYQFLLERTKTGPFDGQRMPDLDFPFHRYLTDKVNTDDIPEGDYPLVRSYPVEEGVYEELLQDHPDGIDVSQEDAFHKLAFREGLGLDDSYLMVDGFSAGRHGHHDGNTIIKYSSEGRIFIGDRDYIERGPAHHTGVMVIKDGVQEEKPPLTNLKWTADVDGIGISRSVVPNYNGADWDRAIVSPGGRFFIIYDRMTFQEEGAYILENTWQTLGEASIHDDGFKVSQQGANMYLNSLDGSDLRMYDRYGHFLKYWKDYYDYMYADEENVLREVQEETFYQAGDKAQFVNVLSSGKDEEEQIKTERINDATLSIQENDLEWIAQWDELDTDQLTSDGQFHLVGENEALLAGVKQLHLGEQQFTFNEPVMVKLDREGNRWQAFALKSGLTKYDEDGNPIGEDPIESGEISMSKQDFKQIMADMKSGQGGDDGDKDHSSDTETAAENWEQVYDFKGKVTSTAIADLNNDGQDDLLLSGDGGQVNAVDQQGQSIWSFQAQGRVNEVSVQEIDEDSLVFIATENWILHVLNMDGEELWQHEFPHGTYQTSEVKGNLLGLTNVRVAYPNGQDEEPWIMVGTQFRYLYGLDLDGNVVYEDLAYYYGIEDMAFVDADGDGKDEGFIGTEYYYYHVWDDQSLADRYGTDGGPGWKVVDVVHNWNGGDLPAAVFGTKEHRIHVIQYIDGVEELWHKNVGGEVNDITNGDFNGDGETEILVGSDGFQFYVFDPTGTERIRTSLEDRVISVDGLHNEVDPYLVSTDNGRLYRLSATGETIKKMVFDDRIADVQVGDQGRQAWVVLENGQVYERTVDANDLHALVTRLGEEGAIHNEQAAHALKVHLTAVAHFEKQEATDKIIKHMKSLKLLLDHQREYELISEKAYRILKANADSVMKPWL